MSLGDPAKRDMFRRRWLRLRGGMRLRCGRGSCGPAEARPARRPSATSASGCSRRWWRRSPRRATRRPRSPTWSSSPGVSRSAFYKHFDDKQACFLAAVEAMVGADPGQTRRRRERRRPGSSGRGKAFEDLIGLIVEQPAAAKMCIVEVYAAGPEGAAVVDRSMDQATELAVQMLAQVPEREGMPLELVRAIVGGIQKVIHKRLYRGQEQELPGLAPQLWDWFFCYPVPPGPLKATRRRTVKAVPFEERQATVEPAGAAAAGAGRGRRREGLPGHHRGRDRRTRLDLAADLLRTLQEQGGRDRRRPRQRLGPHARRRPARLPPRPRLAPRRPRHPGGDVPLRAPKSPSTRGSAGSRCTRRASAPSTSARW